MQHSDFGSGEDRTKNYFIPSLAKVLAYMEKILIYIGNHPNFHFPCISV